MDRIFAREKEINILKKIYSSAQPEFLAVYGRRRIGKTFLIRHFFKNKGLYFELTGLKNGRLKQQLYNFKIEFSRIFGYEPKIADWFEAFNELRIGIEKHASQNRIILFFDELPWLASQRSGFLEALDHFWNRYMTDDPRVILIVCGSAASWMIKKVISNKGGLHGRLTAQIKLLPFDLKETEQFLLQRGIELNRKQLIDLYMAIGGVAKYLTYVEKGQSSLQAISQICFNGPLFREFEELYSSLFEHYTRHVSVVSALAEKSIGLTMKEICEATGLSSGGGMRTILDELEAAGFITPIASTEKNRKSIRYRLMDEYSLFYLKWVPQAKSLDLSGIDEAFWLKIANTPAGRAWAGYAFEDLCMKHIKKIKNSLGISAVATSESEWIYRPTNGNDKRGAQIDLLIDRADQCINLCEIKYSNEPFSIDKDYAMELRSKKSLFIEKSKTRKSVFLTMITTFGLKKTIWSGDIVDLELTMDALFE
jgi:predicted AAA+ superfamily ATPase